VSIQVVNPFAAEQLAGEVGDTNYMAKESQIIGIGIEAYVLLRTRALGIGFFRIVSELGKFTENLL
jgi:hypothetical protein